MRKHGALNRNADGTGGTPNPSWVNRTKKRRNKNKIAKASRRKNR